MLEPRQVALTLMARRLLSVRSLVDGCVCIEHASRRNRNFRVLVRDGPSYLLKQALDADRASSLANEARIYRYLRRHRAASVLKPHLPELCHHDADSGYLITRIAQHARTLNAYAARRRRFPVAVFGILGKTLAALHTVSPPRTRGKMHAHSLEYHPWVGELAAPGIESFRELSAGCIQLIAATQDGDELHQRPGVGVQRVSAVVASLHPVYGSIPPTEVMQALRYPLSDIQPAIRRLHDAYFRNSPGRAPRDKNLLILRAVRMAAVRLVQSVFEQTQDSSQLACAGACALQLSLNILRQPRAALAQLLGLGSRLADPGRKSQGLIRARSPAGRDASCMPVADGRMRYGAPPP